MVASARSVSALRVLVTSAIGIWAASKDDDDTNASRTTTTRTTTRTTSPTTTRTTTPPSTSTAPPGAQAKLMGLLPAGYPAGSCTPDSKPIAGGSTHAPGTQ